MRLNFWRFGICSRSVTGETDRMVHPSQSIRYNFAIRPLLWAVSHQFVRRHDLSVTIGRMRVWVDSHGPSVAVHLCCLSLTVFPSSSRSIRHDASVPRDRPSVTVFTSQPVCLHPSSSPSVNTAIRPSVHTFPIVLSWFLRPSIHPSLTA